MSTHLRLNRNGTSKIGTHRLYPAKAVVGQRRLDSEWWLAAIVSGLVLFAVCDHAHHRHSPYREGWY